jgi:hypothetical protein
MALRYMQKAAVAIPDERSISCIQDIMRATLSSYGFLSDRSCPVVADRCVLIWYGRLADDGPLALLFSVIRATSVRVAAVLASNT